MLLTLEIKVSVPKKQKWKCNTYSNSNSLYSPSFLKQKNTLGPSTYNIRFFGPIFDLPTYPSPIFPWCKASFRLIVSDFHKPTYLPQNRTSYVDGPRVQLRLRPCFSIHGWHPRVTNFIHGEVPPSMDSINNWNFRPWMRFAHSLDFAHVLQSLGVILPKIG